MADKQNQVSALELKRLEEFLLQSLLIAQNIEKPILEYLINIALLELKSEAGLLRREILN